MLRYFLVTLFVCSCWLLPCPSSAETAVEPSGGAVFSIPEEPEDGPAPSQSAVEQPRLLDLTDSEPEAAVPKPSVVAPVAEETSATFIVSEISTSSPAPSSESSTTSSPGEIAALEQVEPPLPKKYQDMVDIVKLQLEMIELRGTVRVRDEDLAQRIVLHESLLQAYCWDRLRRYPHAAPPPMTHTCQAEAAALRELHPSNPLLLCVENGTTTEECRQAYAEKYVAVIREKDKDESGSVDLEAKLASLRTEQNLPQLESEIQKASSEYEALLRSKKRDQIRAAKQKLNTAFDNSLKSVCQPIREKAALRQPLGSKVSLLLSQKPDLKDDEELNKLFSELEHKSASRPVPQKTKAPAVNRDQDEPALFSPRKPADPEDGRNPLKRIPTGKVWRIRYLPEYCLTLIKRVLRFNSQHALAHCYLEGFVAPNCLDALEQAPATPAPAATGAKPSQSKSPKVEPGLVPF